MKQFFKMMFASTFGVFIALGLFFLISIFTLIGIIGNLGSSSTFTPTKNTVYKIELNGTMNDSSSENPIAALLGDTEQQLSLFTVLETIKQAKENDRITGIYLEAGTLSTGSANLEALRRALIDFKESGKFIVAYSDAYSQGCYYLCSVADKVFLNPQGVVAIVGLASQNMFYTGLMEKVGVEMEIFKVGTYKGAVEPFMLDKLSNENREQIESYTSSIWNTLASGMAESRGITINDINHFADEGLIYASPENAVECGLIDGLMFKKEAEEYIREISGQTDEKLKTVGVEQMKNIRKNTYTTKEQIAVIYAEGEIMESGSSSIYDSENLITESLAEELAKLKNDEQIKAVVLRVNSPGGSAFISEQIWYEIEELKKEKPVVVSMGSLAASGGYYISCAADKIIAESNTLTGSIGVFGTFPIIDGALKKIGVTTDVVKTNKYADLGDMNRSFREDEKTLMQAYVERTYDLFLTRCADGRGMSKEAIDAIGQGRVWTGEQAVKNGLVDELGGLDAAILAAAKLADLSDYSVTEVSGSSNFWKDFMDSQLNEIKASFVKSHLGEDFDYFKTVQRIRSASGIQARLPYDIKPL